MPAVHLVSIVIPALNEEGTLPETIRSCREAGGCEVVVADGGSRDRTVAIARELSDAVVSSPMGRAHQMNAGAAAARGGILLFLHADTVLPPEGIARILEAMKDGALVGGAFRIRLLPSPCAGAYARAALRITGSAINLRSLLIRSYTGDQAIFLRAATFRACGGFPEIPLMEDVELSRRMAREGKTILLPLRVGSSGRRWERWGPVRTILLMWRLRIGYLMGMTAAECAERYRRGPTFLTRR
jgi:rSAM/selenodomain-associated transferase 2